MDLKDPAQRAQFESFLRDQYARVENATYYEILGLGGDASTAQVKDVYYKLAARYHPDLYGQLLGVDAKALLVSLYARVVEAYQVLSAPQKRALYDRNLQGGKLRYTTDDERAEAMRSKEPTFSHPNSKRFYLLGQEALRGGNPKAAVQNFKMALGLEPANVTVREGLAQAEEALRAAQPPEDA